MQQLCSDASAVLSSSSDIAWMCQACGVSKHGAEGVCCACAQGMCKDESLEAAAARAARAESAQPKRASLPNLSSSGDAVVPTLAPEFALAKAPTSFEAAPSRSAQPLLMPELGIDQCVHAVWICIPPHGR